MEAHHRIANGLQAIASLVRLQARELARHDQPIDPQLACQVLDNAAERIAALAALNRLLSTAPQTAYVDLPGYLAEICDSLATVTSFAGRITVRGGENGARQVPAGKAAALALLVSELITNAIKYGQLEGAPGSIAVTCLRQPDGVLRIEVSDDGPGLPDGFDPATDGGLGMRVVHSMAVQVGAALEFLSDARGLTVRMHLPL